MVDLLLQQLSQTHGPSTPQPVSLPDHRISLTISSNPQTPRSPLSTHQSVQLLQHRASFTESPFQLAHSLMRPLTLQQQQQQQQQQQNRPTSSDSSRNSMDYSAGEAEEPLADPCPSNASQPGQVQEEQQQQQNKMDSAPLHNESAAESDAANPYSSRRASRHSSNTCTPRKQLLLQPMLHEQAVLDLSKHQLARTPPMERVLSGGVNW